MSRDGVDGEGGPPALGLVQRYGRDVVVRHHLKYDVLVAVAERGAERVGGVSARSPVENNGPLAHAQRAGDRLPLGVRGDVDGSHAVY